MKLDFCFLYTNDQICRTEPLLSLESVCKMWMGLKYLRGDKIIANIKVKRGKVPKVYKFGDVMKDWLCTTEFKIFDRILLDYCKNYEIDNKDDDLLRINIIKMLDF